ncbi:hypothetical protein HANVADRAFT_53171 [Hanseniaspora valbyensis NRRL Y-1626]|uniref:Protein PBN1 n=1 Tax=Hanseniaspora valbyensis NRRL Y-1626 TaxID=766949 RepID=A0A1B7TCJ7_9ASCO|nr:hypothetical protein HANVADRAFT_53171 [Hanseniaspora valbyensis NRRL Y-1626]
MKQTATNSRLTLLFPELDLIYNENTLQIDDNTLLKISAEDSNPFIIHAQEQYTWKKFKPNSNTEEDDVRFTYNNANNTDYHPVIKPILENGYMKYDSDNNRSKFNDFKTFKQNIFSQLNGNNNKIIKQMNDLFEQNKNYQSIDLQISNQIGIILQFTHNIDIINEKNYLIDLSIFDDTGIFYANRKIDQRETNIQGLIFNLAKNKWQKTNFYINTFINTIPLRKEDDLISLSIKQEGIHPQVELKSDLDSSKIPFRDFDDCERYLLLNTPKQVFVNKFDNELKFDTEVWELINQEDHVDLELPDYKINDYNQTYTLFKQNKQYVNSKTVFKFNLHNRYIDSDQQISDDGYTSFDFESTVFDICKTNDPELSFLKTPFMTKNDVGGYINSHFLNSSSPQIYCNILDQSIANIAIPSPDVNGFYNFQWITWATIFFSILYLIKKCFT